MVIPYPQTLRKSVAWQPNTSAPSEVLQEGLCYDGWTAETLGLGSRATLKIVETDKGPLIAL